MTLASGYMLSAAFLADEWNGAKNLTKTLLTAQAKNLFMYQESLNFMTPIVIFTYARMVTV